MKKIVEIIENEINRLHTKEDFKIIAGLKHINLIIDNESGAKIDLIVSVSYPKQYIIVSLALISIEEGDYLWTSTNSNLEKKIYSVNDLDESYKACLNEEYNHLINIISDIKSNNL